MGDIDELLQEDVKRESTLQEEFDRLVALKMEKWDAIKHLALFRETPEWREIKEIDAQLWAIKHQMEVE
jgi:hypothetical protein